MKVAELGRKHGVSEQTIYRWQNKYGGLEVSEVRRLRLLEEDNRRLKRKTLSSFDLFVLLELLEQRLLAQLLQVTHRVLVRQPDTAHRLPPQGLFFDDLAGAVMNGAVLPK